MRILKADSQSHEILGTVYEPDEVDSQGDCANAREIRKACELYNKGPKVVGYMHRQRISPDRAEVLESYITPRAEMIGNELVKTGTWMMRIKIKDSEIWREIEDGKLTGLSMGGRGRYKAAGLDLLELSGGALQLADCLMQLADETGDEALAAHALDMAKRACEVINAIK